MKYTLPWQRQPTPSEVILEQIAEAHEARMRAAAHLEYYQALVQMYENRVKRLVRELKEAK